MIIWTMNEEGLIQCPFCGDLDAYHDKENGRHFVACTQCAARTTLFRLKAMASCSWNTRNGRIITAADIKRDREEADMGVC